MPCHIETVNICIISLVEKRRVERLRLHFTSSYSCFRYFTKVRSVLLLHYFSISFISRGGNHLFINPNGLDLIHVIPVRGNITGVIGIHIRSVIVPILPSLLMIIRCFIETSSNYRVAESRAEYRTFLFFLYPIGTTIYLNHNHILSNIQTNRSLDHCSSWRKSLSRTSDNPSFTKTLSI